MEIRQIKDFKEITSIYYSNMTEDFPLNELKPLVSIEKSLETGIYECYGFFNASSTLGYAFFVKNGRSYLLDYFAITEANRNKGYGSVFLNRLSAKLTDADCVICEVEDPDKSESDRIRIRRKRRLDFYLQNGFRQTSVTSRVFDVSFRILVLSKSKSFKNDEIAGEYSKIYERILPDFFFKTCFSVGV